MVRADEKTRRCNNIIVIRAGYNLVWHEDVAHII